MTSELPNSNGMQFTLLDSQYRSGIQFIRLADIKAGACVAAASAVIGATTAFTRAQTPPVSVDWWPLLALLTALLAVGAAVIALWPRLGKSHEKKGTIYFGAVARAFQSNESGYVDALKSAVADADGWKSEIAREIWANSRIAASKYRWVRVSLLFLCVSLLTLCISAVSI